MREALCLAESRSGPIVVISHAYSPIPLLPGYTSLRLNDSIHFSQYHHDHAVYCHTTITLALHGLRRKGNPWLRCLLVQAAHSALLLFSQISTKSGGKLMESDLLVRFLV